MSQKCSLGRPQSGIKWVGTQGTYPAAPPLSALACETLLASQNSLPGLPQRRLQPRPSETSCFLLPEPRWPFCDSTSGHNWDTSQPLRRYLQASDLAAPSAQGCCLAAADRGAPQSLGTILCSQWPLCTGASNAQCWLPQGGGALHGAGAGGRACVCFAPPQGLLTVHPLYKKAQPEPPQKSPPPGLKPQWKLHSAHVWAHGGRGGQGLLSSLQPSHPAQLHSLPATAAALPSQ